MAEVWLVTVPNRGKDPEQTVRGISQELTRNGMSEVHRVNMPLFNVGTLDSLMSLSDELPKLNVVVENAVRKIERQYADLGGRTEDPLRVLDMPAERFLRNFEWDFARVPRRPLPELIQTIRNAVGRVDEELRTLSQSYQDRVQFLAALKRKKTANYATSDLEDFLEPSVIEQHEFLDTDHLVTLIVIVPRQAEQEFLEEYEQLGQNIAAYGGPDWSGSNANAIGQQDDRFGPEFRRDKVTGSPVVPGSARPILREGDQFVYALTILKSQYTAGYYDNDQFVPGITTNYVQAFKDACKERRYTVRDFSYDPEKAGALDKQIEKSTWELGNLVTTLLRYCRAHYGEIFSYWIHLKVIHAFVESVLRYGLPPDFSAMFVEPIPNRKDQTIKALKRYVVGLGDIYQGPSIELEDDESDDEHDSESTEHLPFVFLKFVPVRA